MQCRGAISISEIRNPDVCWFVLFVVPPQTFKGLTVLVVFQRAEPVLMYSDHRPIVWILAFVTLGPGGRSFLVRLWHEFNFSTHACRFGASFVMYAGVFDRAL